MDSLTENDSVEKINNLTKSDFEKIFAQMSLADIEVLLEKLEGVNDNE